MSGTWPMVLLNVTWVVGLTILAWLLTTNIAGHDAVAEIVVYSPLAIGLIVAFAGAPLRYFLLRQRAATTHREALLADEAARREFESQLARALDMADDEHGVLQVAMLAADSVLPQTLVGVLLADSSRAHLTRATSNTGDDPAPANGCDVATPRGCPAVRTGHALRFADSAKFDTCPHLRQRSTDELTAACIPVSVVGSSVGVVHAVRARHLQLDQHDVTALTALTQQLGSRLGLVRAMSQSQLQAATDPLTGLLSRRSLANEARLLTQEAQPFALVLADLDHFKILNDTHGHDAGDRALRIFARLLQRCVRDHDLVCRYGGEEFIIVLPGRDAIAAIEVFDRIQLELAVVCSDGRTPTFTASAGIADTTEASELTEIISLADSRLLRAKEQGRNRVVVA